jgi:hypothetical protein
LANALPDGWLNQHNPKAPGCDSLHVNLRIDLERHDG